MMAWRKGLLYPILLLGLLLPCVANSALAGESASVTVSIFIPEMLKLVITGDMLVFDLRNPNSGEVFPPKEYPAYYTPTIGSGQNLLKVFCNAKRAWSVTSTASSGLEEAGATMPINRLECLAEDGWKSLDTTKLQIASGERVVGWRELPVQFRLRLEGDEPAYDQAYHTTVIYSLSSL